MKSPTSSIMHSIQALKSKLRSDHLQLQVLRRDFAMGPTKPIMQLQQRQQSPILNLKNQNRSSHSIQKYTRNKIIQLRKTHQTQLKNLINMHKKQKQQLSTLYGNKIQQITIFFQAKIKQQQQYIELLQDQLQYHKQQQSKQQLINQAQVAEKQINTSQYIKNLAHCPKVYELNCSQMLFINKIQFMTFDSLTCHQNQKMPAQKKQDSNRSNDQQLNKQNVDLYSCSDTSKYQNIVNNLLNENATLLQTVERLKMQNRKLLFDSLSKDQKQTQKNELMESKANNQINKRNINLVNRKGGSQSSQYYSIPENMNQSMNRNGGHGKKNRLKFSKASQNRFKSQTNRSFLSQNNQNIDISNIKYRDANSIERDEKHQSVIQNSIVEEQQQSILSQQMKLKTIKHFMKIISHRSTQAQQPITQSLFQPKAQARRSVGIRNALRSVSAMECN